MGTTAQGRFIVHSKGLKDHIFHEVCVDYQNAEVDTQQNKFIKRGTFAKVEASIPSYKKRGVTAIYLMGALERDNYAHTSKDTGEVDYKKPDAS